MAPDINDSHSAITADDLDFRNMESELNADTIDRITNGRWLNDAAIAKLLEFFSSLRPVDVKSIDPLLIDRAPVNNAVTHLLSTSGSDLSVLIPIRCDAHWILVVLRAADKSVLYYNSMPRHDMPKLPTRINQVCQGLISGLDYDIRAAVSAGTLSCPQQLNTVDCGVARIVNGLYTLASRPLPPTTSCDYVLPELVEEPIIDLGTAEPRPARLAASEYRDWARTDRQRLVTHMRSTVDSLAELLSRCRSYRMLITEIVAVLESLALRPDTTLDQELEKLTTSLENVRSWRRVNPVAESALKKKLSSSDACRSWYGVQGEAGSVDLSVQS
ncbi:Ulp1 protease family [Fusarium pseudocircinatum]|uniref:Ulp1 protease family n=1 Tax=Fusarium pseudocircinatum TaxID=56676 RepID=A0A8H5KQ50_9HYPO|nr:Ulp1 protease family [Fusarium pseudocircinatum]